MVDEGWERDGDDHDEKRKERKKEIGGKKRGWRGSLMLHIHTYIHTHTHTRSF